MSAVFTVNIMGSHVLLSTIWVREVSHTSSLPWVFSRVQEENVINNHVVVSVVGVSIVNSWTFELEMENSLAVIDPVVMVQSKGSGWVKLVWFLEPSELTAVLPCPLSAVLGGVNSGVHQCLSIVLICTNFESVLGKVCDDLNWGNLKPFVLEDIAQVGSVSVLNSHSENVRNEPHEVVMIDLVILVSEHVIQSFFLSGCVE